MFALAIDGVTKSYPGRWGKPPHPALRGVSLSLPRGQAFGLIGPNGAGKTTLIKILLGIVFPSGGAIEVLGGDPQSPDIRRRIGYLPERLELPAFLSPRDVLASVARLKGHPLAPKERDALLERVGLGAVVDKATGGFSKGMRQRLGLATAMLGSPELLILDEPTDGIDPLGRVEVRALLAEELARGATVLLNSHLLAETERICHRFGILLDGRLVKEGSLGDLRNASRRWRLRVEGVSAETMLGLGFVARDRPGTYELDAEDPAAMNAALDRVRAAGGFLIELAPSDQDLESLLAASVADAGREPLSGERVQG